MKFCQLVINHADAAVEPFSLNTKVDGGATTDQSAGFTFMDDGYDDVGTSSELPPASDSTEDSTADSSFYKITKYQDTKSTLTCCGNRLLTLDERILNWLAAVGGFAGLVHGFMTLLSGTDTLGTCCSGKQDEDDDRSSTNGDVEMKGQANPMMSRRLSELEKRLEELENSRIL
jgi:hypothetical protein